MRQQQGRRTPRRRSVIHSARFPSLPHFGREHLGTFRRRDPAPPQHALLCPAPPAARLSLIRTDSTLYYHYYFSGLKLATQQQHGDRWRPSPTTPRTPSAPLIPFIAESRREHGSKAKRAAPGESSTSPGGRVAASRLPPATDGYLRSIPVPPAIPPANTTKSISPTILYHGNQGPSARETCGENNLTLAFAREGLVILRARSINVVGPTCRDDCTPCSKPHSIQHCTRRVALRPLVRQCQTVQPH